MTSENPNPGSFGPNQWLVDELFEQYRQDKQSVDPAWWDFFADYVPSDQSPVSKIAVEEPKIEFISAPEQTRQIPPANAAPTANPSTQSAPETPTTVATSGRDLRPSVEGVDAPADEAAPEIVRLKGASGRVVVNMEASLAVPTATSVRAIPAKLMVDNRIRINEHLARNRGGKVSFTHIIGFAIAKALADMPEMNYSYTEVDGKPAVIQNRVVNIGLAIDVQKSDGTRQLLVPGIKNAGKMDFYTFWITYEEIVRKARTNKLTVEDFAGITASLTNPGGIGTVHSVPRLMQGQAVIIGVGSLDYPAEFMGSSEKNLLDSGVSKVVTLTSTYDHRIIQGAQSGDFLRRVHEYLTGASNFYHDIFASLRIPYEPVVWSRDITASHDSDVDKTTRVHELINAYRESGHLIADIDPLEYSQRAHPDLKDENYGLTLWDLDREFAVGGFAGRTFMKWREALTVLRDAYSRTIGIEYMHIQDPVQRAWIQEKVERGYEKLEHDEQIRILHKLNAAEAFETFLQTKYVGQKRFSLEGGESAIPLVDAILQEAADADYEEVAIGMPHRGRLNMLANIAGKSYGLIFREFEGHYGNESVQGSGDVKYHLGTRGVFESINNKTTNVYLAANPSHLEAVNPVLEGIVRAKQDQMPMADRHRVLPILMHGDAAFAGQGIVQETLNMAQLQGYRVNGTIHVVVNNQVGFTTSPRYSRSTTYCTDVAKGYQAPIFHVNGDDPEAVVRVARLAFEFRQEFKKDVIIDLVCYRRRGHNEADDPSLTQPLMYELIEQKRSVRKLYTESLIGRGDISVEEAEAALKHFQDQLETIFQETKNEHHGDDQLSKITRRVMTEGQIKLDPQIPAFEVQTGISNEVVQRVVRSQLTMPEGFIVHPRLAPQLKRREDMVANNEIDWGMAEALAVGSLLTEGTSVRMSGQDIRRGTFGHRHAVIVDRQNGWQYKPLKTCYEDGAKLFVYDSPLSEFGVLGFEYGYSVERPNDLVIWEAQFGDFINGAQTIVDEYISSGEQKWGQRSAVTLLLPHGFEGQGPDHSSARVERFLQLCAQDNMTVAMPSSAASYFHLLRWQVKSERNRPLIVFTPKSLLRAKHSASAVDEFTSGTFKAAIADDRVDRAQVKKVLFCSGKVYYDLVAEREKRGAWDVAIIRLERLYPLPVRTLPKTLEGISQDAVVRYVQEEPANQGAWPFMSMHLSDVIGRPVQRVSRPSSSSPAVGSHHRHEVEQATLVEAAFE